MGTLYAFEFACTGGTFGPLHDGHKYLFEKAFGLSENLFVRLTSDKYLEACIAKIARDRIPHDLERYTALHSYLHQFYRGRFEIVMLDEKENCENCDFRNLTRAIICGQDSVGKAYALNIKRRESGLYEAEIIGVPVKCSRDKERISSSRMRSGQINERGELLLRKAALLQR